jgi:hypothetical protein
MVKRRRVKTISSDDAITAIRGRGFFARHGGRSAEELRRGTAESGCRGWWEMGATDGYRLRCDWVRIVDEEQLNFSELAPGSE